MPRVEDGPLLRGQARFVDDLNIPGALHVAFLRSPLAHARIKSVGTSAAWALPGVHAVLTFADLRPLLTSDRIPQALPAGAIKFDVDPYALAQGRSHLCRRAGRDDRGRQPPHRRGCTGADRARSRSAAGRVRPGRRPCARRGQGAARLPGQPGGAAEHRLRRRRRCLRQGRASHRRALPPAQGWRPFDRDARHRSALRRHRWCHDRVRQQPDAAPRQANPGGGARALRA